MKKHLIPFAGILLFAGAMQTIPVRADVVTGFEESEGFHASSAANNAGWTFTPGSSRIRVSDGLSEPALNGTLSVYAEAAMPGEPGAVTAANWNWANKEEHLSSYLFSFTNPTAAKSGDFNIAWIYISLWDEGTSNIRKVQLFVGYAADPKGPRVIRYRNGSDTAITAAIPEKAAVSFSGWTKVRASFDFDAQSYQVYVNDVAVGGAVALPSAWNLTAIVGTQLVSPRSGVTYYDNVTAASKPSSAAILGGAAGLEVLGYCRMRQP